MLLTLMSSGKSELLVLQGHLSDAWSRVTKNAIAETIIALTKMEEEYRSPVRCIATTRVREVRLEKG